MCVFGFARSGPPLANFDNPFIERDLPKSTDELKPLELSLLGQLGTSRLPSLKDQLDSLQAPMGLADRRGFMRVNSSTDAPTLLMSAAPCRNLAPEKQDDSWAIARGFRSLYDWADGLRELFPTQQELITDRPSPRQTDKWKREHEDLAKKAQTTDASLVFFGDSITKGMSLGNQLQNEFGCKAENFGIVGDSTQHLLWRMQNGEMEFKKAPEKGVILIGANNIGAASNEDIVKGIIATVNEARTRQPDTKWLVLGVLPQGKSASDPRRATIEKINSLVQQELSGKANVTFMDVNKKMLEPDGSMSDNVWWRDGLHPKNYTPLFKAIRPTLDNM